MIEHRPNLMVSHSKRDARVVRRQGVACLGPFSGCCARNASVLPPHGLGVPGLSFAWLVLTNTELLLVRLGSVCKIRSFVGSRHAVQACELAAGRERIANMFGEFEELDLSPRDEPYKTPAVAALEEALQAATDYVMPKETIEAREARARAKLRSSPGGRGWSGDTIGVAEPKFQVFVLAIKM